MHHLLLGAWQPFSQQPISTMIYNLAVVPVRAQVIAHNGALPKLQCKTCNQCFHSGCLYKWFQQSSKSNCPHCQSPWV